MRKRDLGKYVLISTIVVSFIGIEVTKKYNYSAPPQQVYIPTAIETEKSSKKSGTGLEGIIEEQAIKNLPMAKPITKYQVPANPLHLIQYFLR